MQAIPPDPCSLAKLSKGQKVCLRLVHLHISAKDMARKLDISPHMVDARLYGMKAHDRIIIGRHGRASLSDPVHIG